MSSAGFQRECFQFLPIQYDIGCWFVINSFYYFVIRSINTEFIEGFLHKGLLNFVECLLCINGDNHVVFVFGSVYVVNYIYRLAYVEQALHPGMNAA